MLETIFCKHYQSMSDHDACKVGVEYATLKGIPFEKRPCFAARKKGYIPPGGCDLAEFPTKEEREADDKRREEQFARTILARAAIVEFCGGPWKEGTAGTSGRIDCPVCGGEKTLGFSRAGYNGHIHAGCKTEGCVRWME
jgi:hypothetical protein